MSDPLVKKVVDDDGVERYVAADGPSDPDATPLAERGGDTPAGDGDGSPGDVQGKVVEKEAPDAGAADAADGDGANPRSRRRRS